MTNRKLDAAGAGVAFLMILTLAILILSSGCCSFFDTLKESKNTLEVAPIKPL